MPRDLIRTTVGAALALSIGVLAAPAAASAAWSTPADLSNSGEDAVVPVVAVDDDGDAVFAWHRSDGVNDRVEFQTRTAAGMLGVAQRLSRAGQPASDQQVAITPGGDAVFTWVRSDGTNDLVQARALSASGVLSRVRTLSDPGHDANDPQVAVDPDGDAVVVWTRHDGTEERIQASTVRASGRVSGPFDLSDPGGYALHPDVAVDDAGNAVVTWTRNDGDDDRVQVITRSAAGVVSVPLTLSDDGGDAHSPHVEVDGDGDAYLTWAHFDGISFRIQSLLLDASGTPGITHSISDEGAFAGNPELAVDDNGDAVIVYERPDGIGGRWIEGVKMSPADTVGTPEILSDTSEVAAIPDVAVDDDGDGVVTWHRFDGSDNRIQAATIAANGVFGTPETLSDAGERAAGDQVAVDADGDAIVAWYRFDGTDQRVQYAAGP